MTSREVQAEPASAPPAAEEKRAPSGPAGVELLQRTIGNRAVGSLLRQRVLARDLVGKPRTGQLIKGEKNQIYEVISSDFNRGDQGVEVHGQGR